MLAKVLAAATIACVSLSATASPATVKPLTVKNGSPCSLDTDCTDGNYCRQTPAQRKAGAATGVCSSKRDLGAVCYKDTGCLSGNCVNSSCAYLAPSSPQIQCTRKMTGSMGSLSLDDYDALTTKPTQPYLTFNRHYADISDGTNREIMTTSGPKNKIAFEYWECPSTSMNFEAGAGQIRVPSKGQKLCLTADVPTQGQCPPGYTTEGSGCVKRRSSVSGSGLAPLYVAPCKFADDASQISNQYWAVGGELIIRRLSAKPKRGMVPHQNDDPSVPFVLADGSLAGVAVTANNKAYSSWLLDTTYDNSNASPMYLLPNSTTY